MVLLTEVPTAVDTRLAGIRNGIVLVQQRLEAHVFTALLLLTAGGIPEVLPALADVVLGPLLEGLGIIGLAQAGGLELSALLSEQIAAQVHLVIGGAQVLTVVGLAAREQQHDEEA